MILGCNNFFMIRSQTIFLDNTPYDIQSGSIIESGTEVLNIIIADATPQTDCQIIGDRFEYKPCVWLEYEQECISGLQELNIIFLESRASAKLKKQIRNLFPNLNTNFFELLHYGNAKLFDMVKKYKVVEKSVRQNNCYFSTGTMRLPRFYLVWYCQHVGIDNFGCQEIGNNVGNNVLDDFLYQLEKLSKSKKNFFPKFKNFGQRFFGDMTQSEFQHKQMSLLENSRINVVSHYPFYDYITHFYDEKLTFPIRSKTLPFFFDNRGADQDIEDFGFKPYLGFDYSAQDIENFVERWHTLLENNKSFFLDEHSSKEIYNLNLDIIDNNYKVLMETNWIEKAISEFMQLPLHIKDAIENNTKNFL